MKPCTIFVEGPSDESFLKELFKRMTLGKPNIITFKGWTNIVSKQIEEAVDDAIENNAAVLIIFDADDPSKGGGIQPRLKAIEAKLGVPLFAQVRAFLFPDNQSDGDFETLLDSMACDRTPIDDCWRSYEQCLAEKNYNRPTRKSMMHEYAAAIDASVWEHEGFNKSFANDAIWDWSAPALDPLKTFLRNALQDK